jgi:hypothetical protein
VYLHGFRAWLGARAEPGSSRALGYRNSRRFPLLIALFPPLRDGWIPIAKIGVKLTSGLADPPSGRTPAGNRHRRNSASPISRFSESSHGNKVKHDGILRTGNRKQIFVRHFFRNQPGRVTYYFPNQPG